MTRCSLMAAVIAATAVMVSGGCKKAKEAPKKSPTVEEKSAEAMKASRIARTTPRKTDGGKEARPTGPAGTTAGDNVGALVGSKVLLVFASKSHKLHHPSCQGKVTSVGRIGLMLDRTTTWDVKKKAWIASPAKVFLPWANVRELKIMGK